MALLRVEGLPEAPLAAAALFHSRDLPHIADLAGGPDDAITLVLAPADHTHRGWRLAAVQSLARALAPRRVNALASDDAAAIAAALAWLEVSPGVTGQYWPLDGTGLTGA